MGVIAYLGQAYMTPEILAALPEADQAYYNNMPAWATAAFALGVFGGALGSLALLLKKKWATALFTLSLVAVLVNFVYNFIIQNDMEVTGTKMIMPVLVIGIAVFLVWYSKKATANSWLS